MNIVVKVTDAKERWKVSVWVGALARTYFFQKGKVWMHQRALSLGNGVDNATDAGLLLAEIRAYHARGMVEFKEALPSMQRLVGNSLSSLNTAFMFNKATLTMRGRMVLEELVKAERNANGTKQKESHPAIGKPVC
jgi:hypothetical protein